MGCNANDGLEVVEGRSPAVALGGGSCQVDVDVACERHATV